VGQGRLPSPLRLNSSSPRRGSWLFATANVTAWGSGKTLLEWWANGDEPLPDFVFLQEHRLKAQGQLDEATARCRHLGWRLFSSPAVSTGPGALESSGGVAIAVRSFIGAGVAHDFAEGAAAGRALACHCSGLLPRGFVAISLYLHVGRGLKGGRPNPNLAILGEVADYLAGLRVPWVIAGDWNLQPQDRALQAWVSCVGGVIWGPGEATCSSGRGSEIDFVVVSRGLGLCQHQASVDHLAPIAPHSPVKLIVNTPRLAEKVWTRVRYKSFPTTPPVGCAPEPPAARWSWPVGGAPSSLEAGWRQWAAQAERELCSVLGLTGMLKLPYIGRGTRQAFVQRPLEYVFRRLGGGLQGEEAHRWRAAEHILRKGLALARRLAGPVAGSPGWLGPRSALLGLLLDRPGLLALGVASVSALCLLVDQASPSSLEALVQEAASIAEKASLAFARTRLHSWRQWAQDSVARGGRLAHRFSRGPPPAEVVLGASGLPVAGTAALSRLLDEWQGYWRVGAGPASHSTFVEDLWAAARGETATPITLEMLDDALGHFGDAVGTGLDDFNPKVFKMLSQATRERLLDLFRLWEKGGAKAQSLSVLVVLIPKDGGGVRPIGLTPSLLRLWSRIRSGEARRWQDAHDDPAFWGAAGRSCDTAGWHHNLYTGYAATQGWESATLFLDIKKFYDHIDLETLCVEALRQGFPLWLMAPLVQLYTFPRSLQYEGIASILVHATRSIVAGCSCATTMARVLLVAALRRVQQAVPPAMVRNVVDDISLQAVGPRAQVVRWLGEAGSLMTQSLVDLRLPVSFEKSAFIASSIGLARLLRRRWKDEGFAWKGSVRNLGIQAAGRGRCTRIAAVRHRRSRLRGARLLRLRAAGAHVGQVHRAGPVAGALWGSSSSGWSDKHLAQLRLGSLRSFVKVARGTSVGLKLRALGQPACADPSVVHHGDIVQHWATAVWTGSPPLAILEACLKRAVVKLGLLRHPWPHASDPAQVFWLSLRRLGWRTQGARRIVTDFGLTLDLLRIAPKAVAELAKQAAQRWSDRAALRRLPGVGAAGAAGAGADGAWAAPVFWMGLLPNLTGQKGLDWTQHHMHMLRSIVSGSCWCQARQFRVGVSSAADCRLCGARGTLWHRRYGCPAWATHRCTHVSPELAQAAASVLSQGEGAGELFARGLFPDLGPIVPRPLGRLAAQIHWFQKPDHARLSGSLFTDGSSTPGPTAHFQRAGWAVAMVGPEGQTLAVAFGPLPEEDGPQQSAPEAEDYAISMLPLVAELPFTIYTDCLSTARALLKGPQGAAAVKSGRAHLWQRFWAAFEPSDYAVVKVAAHTSLADVYNGTIQSWERAGNRAADSFAKAGSAQHAIAPWLAEVGAGALVLASVAARWAARQEVHIGSLALPDMDDLGLSSGRPRRPRQPAVPALPAPGRSRPGLFVEPSSDLARAPEAISARTFLGHDLRVAPLLGHGAEGNIVICLKCGAFAVALARGLRRPCRGSQVGPTALAHVARVSKGLHPNSHQSKKGLAVGMLSVPPTSLLAWLQAAAEVGPAATSATSCSAAASASASSSGSPPALAAGSAATGGSCGSRGLDVVERPSLAPHEVDAWLHRHFGMGRLALAAVGRAGSLAGEPLGSEG
jgi:hypothetical protein